MTTKSMKQRLRRVAGKAANKKKAARRSSRRALINHLEKEASDAKSRSFDEQAGGAKGSATDQYDRKKNLPSPKGDDAEMDYDWEAGEGYPSDGNSPAGLGSGDKSESGKSKSKQQALDDADEERRKNTSEMEPMTHNDPSRPRPKLSSAKRRQWRRKRIAELKKALTDEEARNLDTTELSSKDLGNPMSKEQVAKMDAKAPASARKNAFKVYQLAKEKIPALFGSGGQAIAQANDQLEDAIMSNDLRKMKAAMAMLLTQVQAKAKENMQEMVALGKTIRTVFKGMSPKMASSQATAERFSYLSTHHAMVEKFDHELKRAAVLMRMASKQVESLQF